MPKITAHKRDAQVTLRIPTWLRHEMALSAKRDRRSLADVIVFALEAKKWCGHLLKKPDQPCPTCAREKGSE
jgi:hypothetical protein